MPDSRPHACASTQCHVCASSFFVKKIPSVLPARRPPGEEPAGAAAVALTLALTLTLTLTLTEKTAQIVDDGQTTAQIVRQTGADHDGLDGQTGEHGRAKVGRVEVEIEHVATAIFQCVLLLRLGQRAEVPG